MIMRRPDPEDVVEAKDATDETELEYEYEVDSERIDALRASSAASSCCCEKFSPVAEDGVPGVESDRVPAVDERSGPERAFGGTNCTWRFNG
jgi:hypothetical protein